MVNQFTLSFKRKNIILLPLTLLPFFRSFAKPPKAVQVICECILVMKGYREISWKQAKAMMSEANFLKGLMEMDVDAIGLNQVKRILFLLLHNFILD